MAEMRQSGSPCTCRLYLDLTNRGGESARYKVAPLPEGHARRPAEAMRAYQLTKWSHLEGRWQWGEQYVGWQDAAGHLHCTCPDVSYLQRKARRDEEAGVLGEEKEYQCKHVRALVACGLLTSEVPARLAVQRGRPAAEEEEILPLFASLAG